MLCVFIADSTLHFRNQSDSIEIKVLVLHKTDPGLIPDIHMMPCLPEVTSECRAWAPLVMDQNKQIQRLSILKFD